MNADWRATLLDGWKQAFGQYSREKELAEKAVMRWEWTSGERYSCLPHYFLRFPGRGRILKAPPTSVGNYAQYGFSEQGKIRLQRTISYREINPGNRLLSILPRRDSGLTPYSESFYRYSDSRIEIVEYSVFPHIPLRFQQIFLENHRVLFYASIKLNGYTPVYGKKGKDPSVLYEWLGTNGRFITAEEYSYDGERLVRISGFYEVPGSLPYSSKELFSYAGDGELFRIERHFESGQKGVIYQKPHRGQTFQLMRAEATQRLVEAVTKRLKAVQFPERVYGIHLAYQKVLQHFPPAIVLLPESYRINAIQSTDPSARYTIFSPILDQEYYYLIEDPEVLEFCQLLEQEIKSGQKWDAATSILRDIAASLTHQDWTGILNTTPDFVVYALDPELESDQIYQALRSSVSQKQIDDWKTKGWLDSSG